MNAGSGPGPGQGPGPGSITLTLTPAPTPTPTPLRTGTYRLDYAIRWGSSILSEDRILASSAAFLSPSIEEEKRKLRLNRFKPFKSPQFEILDLSILFSLDGQNVFSSAWICVLINRLS